MPKLNKRQQQAQNTKQALFDSAIALFKEKGFDDVTVEEIARRAGTAKGSFYTYFRTKSDIIIEEFREIDHFYEKYARNLKRYKTATEKLLAFTRSQLRYVRDQVGPETLKILYANNLLVATTDKILIDPARFLHTLMRDIMAEGQSTGEFRIDRSVDELSYLVNRSMRSIFLDWAISRNAWDLVKEGCTFCEVILLPALCYGGDPVGKGRKAPPLDSLRVSPISEIT